MKKLPIAVRLMRLYFNSIGRLFPKKSAQQLIKLFSTPRSRVIRQKEIEVLQTASESFFEFRGDTIKVYHWGSGEKYALLCHGWESNAGSLGAFIDPLIQRGYKVISYDGPAHGNSEGSKASLLTFKAVAKKVIEHFGKPDLAIGHSLGANVIVLLSYEEKLEIEKSILIAPVNQIRTVFEGFRDIFNIPGDIYKRMLQMISRRTQFQLDGLVFSELGKESKLKQVLLMHDVDDKITSFSHSKSMKKSWQKIDLRPIKGSGHYKICWHEETLKNAQDFIDN